MKKYMLAAACGLFLTAGLASAQVYVRVGPPRPIHEVPPPPPRPGAVWHGGYHRWDGAHYVWVPGEYVDAPRPGVRWVPGHWAHRPGGYIWIEGHWV